MTQAAQPAATGKPAIKEPRLWGPALVCLLLLLLEIYALFSDFGEVTPATIEDQPVIATYVAGLNEVRKRPSGTIIWNVPQAGSELRRNDAILTMNGSEALVEFKDGANISIGSDSLVILEKTPIDRNMEYQRIVLRLMQGSLAKQSQGQLPMSIEAGESRVEDPDGTATFNLSRTKDGLTVEVASGNLSVGQGDAMRTVQPFQRATIQSGKVSVEDVPMRFESVSPSQGTRLGRDEKGDEVVFSWKRAIAADAKDLSSLAIKVRVSSQPDLSNSEEIDAEADGSGAFHAKYEPAEDGKYYWQVWSADGRFSSPVTVFEVITRQTPRVLAPDDDLETLVGRSVEIRWEPQEHATVVLETSPEVSFTTGLTRISMRPGQSSAELNYDEPQVLYWRLRSEYGGEVGSSQPTEPRRLEVKAKPLLKAPKKLRARVRMHSSAMKLGPSRVSGVEKASEPSALRELPKKKISIDLEWDIVEGAKNYHLQISKSENFDELLVDRTLKRPRFTYRMKPPIKPTTLYFRVSAMDADGTEGTFSTVQEVKISPLPKEKTPKRTDGSPVLAEEDEPRSRGSMRMHIAVGGAYHTRSFKSDTRPTTTDAKGVVALGNIELSKLLGTPPEDPDELSGASLVLGAWVLAEKAEPTTARVLVETFPVSLLRTWAGIASDRWGGYTTFAGYGTTSQKFSWKGRRAQTERVICLGLLVSYANSSVSEQSLHWRVQLGLMGAGAIGADLNASARKYFGGGSVRAHEAHGFFIEAEAMIRFTNIETSYAPLLKVGYAR